MSHRLHTHHTHTCRRTQTGTHSLELMKIPLHPGLSNRPNNRESLGALRVSGRLQDAPGLDGQVLGSDTPTLTHANTQLSFSRRASFIRRNHWPDHKEARVSFARQTKLLITGWNVGSSITHMTYPIVVLFSWATHHLMHTYCILALTVSTSF